MMGEYRYIGKVVPRIDARAVVTGNTGFVNDLRMSEVLYGKVLRSPHPHARIRRIDTRMAEQMPGVRAMLTYDTVPDWRFGNPPVRVMDQVVRYVGDAVVLVAADSERIAAAARKLIYVDYEILPAVFDEYEAMKPDAPQLYGHLPGNLLPLGDPIFGPTSATAIIAGDVEAGFAEADVVVEGSFGYENIPNAIPMEAPVVIVHWQNPDQVTAWVSNQSVYLSKQVLSAVFGEAVRVRVIGGACGGSFGTKIMSWQIQCYAAALSKATGKPVKMAFSKEEQLGCFVMRPSTRLEGTVGMKADGTVTAVAGSWILGTGYYSMTTQAQVAVGCGEAMVAVRCKNWDVRPKVVCTNRNASGVVRGFGGQELKCALFPLMSLAMAKLELDPFEVLKKNFVKPGDGYFWRDSLWYNYRGIDYSPVMEEGARVFGWKDKWKGWLSPTAVNGSKLRGIGVGVHGNADIGEDVEEAWVHIDTNGSVMLHSSLSEHGTGQRSNAVKCVAEVLQVPYETVSIIPADPSLAPISWGPIGSRGTYAILSAVIAAAEDARRKLLALAAPVLNAAAPDELETSDRFVWHKHNPEKRVSWNEVIGLRTIIGEGRFDFDHTLSNCMMSFVEVEVDADTGKVELLRVVNATDAGKIIDPQGLQGQMYGCLGTAGIDSALFEETVLDPITGRVLNANLVDYKWRTSAELPSIENVIFETPMSSHRFHAVGVGEIATSPGPSAVLMATANAIGQWLYEYPVTPERILATIGETSREKAGLSYAAL